MKNILVYITILIMMMPSMKLSADITLRTNDPFATKGMPLGNNPFAVTNAPSNNPFAGGTPKEIERNLFAPKQVQSQYRVANLDQNRGQHKSVSYLNNEVVVSSHNTQSLSSGNNATVYRKYNMPYNNSASNTIVTYNMPTTIDLEISEINDDEGDTTEPEIPSYDGSGAPSEYAPIGDAVLPLLLLAMVYVVVMRRKKESIL